MSQKDDADTCHWCKRGRLVRQRQDLAFYQWTDKGYIFCSAEIPRLICESCGSKAWDDVAESIIEEVVRLENDKLR
jgi:YgiT-type zinc finger domain-containing protein